MKVVSFLFSTRKTLFPKTGLLLEGNNVATIDDYKEEHATGVKATVKASEVIKNTVVNNIVWWWPSGRGKANMFGLLDFEIISMFTVYGFSINKDVIIEHAQVPEDDERLRGYVEVKMSLSDEKYAELLALYGPLK